MTMIVMIMIVIMIIIEKGEWYDYCQYSNSFKMVRPEGMNFQGIMWGGNAYSLDSNGITIVIITSFSLSFLSLLAMPLFPSSSL